MVVDILRKSLDDIDIILADNEFRPHLGASIAGHGCDRKIWLDFRFAKIKNFTAKQLRIFDKGREVESVLIKKLKVLPEVKVISTQERFSDGHIAGSCDAIIEVKGEKYVVEIKSSKQEIYNEIVKSGCKDEHFVQMQLYMHYFKIPKAIYIVESKNTQEYFIEEIEYDQKFAEYIIERLKRIVDAKEPPEKLSDKPTYFICKMCDYYRICHDNASVHNTCRSCVNIKIQNDEPIFCNVHKKIIPFNIQVKDRYMNLSCKKYEMLPQLISQQKKEELTEIVEIVKESFGDVKIVGVKDNEE